MDQKVKNAFLHFQKNELTESIIYIKLAAIEKNAENREILLKIADEEIAHYHILKKFSGEDVKPDKFRMFRYYWLARVLGLTFALKLMESGEGNAHTNYAQYKEYPELLALAQDEQDHEDKLIKLINEERLNYMGSVVLGLNDALVEFTGALAGFTLALNDPKLIALTGSITGVAAALSMASSEYLSKKSDHQTSHRPVKAAIYTGITYLFTVIALVLPFILIDKPLIALCVMLGVALSIIALFNFYYCVARGESFKRRFTEMAILSFSVAGVSFMIGFALKKFAGIDG